MNRKSAVAVFSGGLDSTTLVYDMIDKGYEPHLVSFDYGQRHKKELEYAKLTAQLLGLRHDIVDLTGIAHLISNSALTAPMIRGEEPGRMPHYEEHEIEVPEGHYAEDNMKLTVVPNRNMIMLSIAAGIAVNEGAALLGVGVHAGDHFVYPDCRPQFIRAANAAIVLGNEGFGSIPKQFEGTELTKFIYAPFRNMSKINIAYRAILLNVPFENTWSCYKGGEKHCGRCGTCVERLEAIDEARAEWEDNERGRMAYDRTAYEDSEYWKTVTKNAGA